MIYNYRDKVSRPENKSAIHNRTGRPVEMNAAPSFSGNKNIIQIPTDRSVSKQRSGKQNTFQSFVVGDVIGWGCFLLSLACDNAYETFGVLADYLH